MKANIAKIANCIADDMQIFYELIGDRLGEEIANEFDGRVSFLNTGFNLARVIKNNLGHYAPNNNFSQVYELNKFFRDFNDEKCPKAMDEFNIKFYLNVVAGQSVKTLNTDYTECVEDGPISCYFWVEDAEGNYIVGRLDN